MIDMDIYIAFVLATTLLILMPGPIVTLTVANSLADGKRGHLRNRITGGLMIGTGLALAFVRKA